MRIAKLVPAVFLMGVVSTMPRSADAQEIPGALTNSGGVTASKATPVVLNANPAWVDAAGRVIALDEDDQYIEVTESGQQVLRFSEAPPECWDVSGMNAVRLGRLLEPAGRAAGDFWFLAVEMGEDPLALRYQRTGTAWKVGVFGANCDGAMTALGEVAVPGPPEDEILTLHDGVVFVVEDGALLALDTRGSQETAPRWEAVAGLVEVQSVGTTPSGAVWVSHGVGGLSALENGVARTLRAVSQANGTGGGAGLWGGASQILPFTDFGDAVFLGRTSFLVAPTHNLAVLGVLPEDAPTWTDRYPPWPTAEGFEGTGHLGFIGGDDGAVYARHRHDWPDDAAFPGQIGRRYSLRRVGVDAAVADFDRDGLTRAHEDALGTSDQAYDSDGDGANDGAEVAVYQTDPSDPTSRKRPAAVALPRLAPSLLIADAGSSTRGWVRLPDATGGLMCKTDIDSNCPPAGPGRSLECYDAAFQTSCRRWPYQATSKVAITTDGRFGYYVGPEFVGIEPEGGVALQRMDLVAGLNTTLVGPDAWAAWEEHTVGIWPLSGEDAVLEMRQGSDVHLFRWSGASGQLQAISTAQWDSNWRVIGRAPDVGGRAAAIVADGERLLAVMDDRVGFLADRRVLTGGLPMEHLLEVPGGGLVAQALRWSTSADRFVYAASAPLDGGLEPAGSPGYIGEKLPLGDWFSHGFEGTVQIFYKQLVSYAVCLPKDIECGGLQTEPVQDAWYTSKAEWVPVPTALEPGEVIAASLRTYMSPPSNEGGPPTPLRVWSADGTFKTWDTSEPAWRLWRVTRLGAVDTWLDADAFGAHADGPGRESLARAPLGSVGALRSAPDGARICMAEAGAGRVWELRLAAGVLSEVTLAEERAGVVGCAYDEAGQLAVLTRAPGEVRVGFETMAVPGEPFDMIRDSGTWLVRGAGGRATCVTDDGQATGLAETMIALGELQGGGALYVDEAHLAWAARDLCGPGPARVESLIENRETPEVDQARPGLPQCHIDGRAIAMRPDGMVLLSGCMTEVFFDTLLIRVFPSFVPRDPSLRIETLDPFRRRWAVSALMSDRLVDVTAMVTLPGGSAGADWGQFNPIGAPTTPDWSDDTVPEPEPNPVEPPKTKPPDEGCGTGGTSWPTALLVLVAVWVGRATLRVIRT